MTTQLQFIKRFKEKHDLDFRKDKFLTNQYNNVPTFNYDFAKKIVYEINKDLINLFDNQYVRYNLSIDIESLRIKTLKNYIEERVFNYYQSHALSTATALVKLDMLSLALPSIKKSDEFNKLTHRLGPKIRALLKNIGGEQ